MTQPAPQRARSWLTADRVTWIVTVIAVTVFWLISTSFRPWDLFDRAGFSSDFYDEQARVFLRGRLAVDPAVPGPEGFLIGGKTYLYYGPFLAVVRLPFAIFGDVFVGRLVRVSMLIALVVVCRWSARLALAGRRVVVGADAPDDPTSGRWASGAFVSAVAFSPALFAAGWISVYHETEIWALALALVATTLLVEWAASGFTDRRLVIGSGCAALACTLTRAPIGLGVAMAIGVCGLVLVVRGRRAAAPTSTATVAIAGGLVPLVAHAVVNRAKFGSWMSVPGDRQLLSLQDQTRAAFFETTGGSFFSIDFLQTTIVQYLRPDAIRFERLIPGIRFGPLAQDRGATAVETVTPASSMTTSALLLLLLALVGVFWVIRKRALAWGLVIAATGIATLPTFMIGFIANRYLIDLLPPLITAAALGVWAIDPTQRDGTRTDGDDSTSLPSAARPRWRVVRAMTVVLATFGLWVNASLAIWTLELKSPGFTELRYDVDRLVFSDGGAPALVRIAPGDPAGRDGVVGLSGDCGGVYISEQGAWVPLDRADGQRAISGTADVATTTVLASTSGWSLELHPIDPGRAVAVFARADGIEGIEREIILDGPTIDFDVVSDSIANTYVATIGDDSFFLPADIMVDSGTDLRPGGGSGAESTLCTELATSLVER